MPITDMGFDISPKTIILELLDYNYIYDEFLTGIEELVEKEITLHSTEILKEKDQTAYEDPYYAPTEICIYRNYKDIDGYATWFVQRELPSLIRGSALVTLFSIFENNIKFICDKFFCFFPMKIKYDDLAGRNALEKLKTALKILDNKIIEEGRVYFINEKLFEQDIYKMIRKIKKIRDKFAHANGTIKNESEKQIFKDRDIKKHFRIDGDRIVIEKGALFFVSQTMRNFCESILKS